MILGFLGGTGIEGKGLALRFADAGASVLLGSRSAERARETAEAYNRILGRALIRGLENAEMLSEARIVFLTVPFDKAVPAVEAYRGSLRDQHILVDVTVPLRFEKGRPHFVEQPEGSNAERIARHLPEGIPLVAAFKTIPAHILADPAIPLECDVFVCGGTEDARERVIEAVRAIPSLRPLDAGSLETARALERMTWLAIHLNRRYRSRGARYRIQGI